MSANFISAEQTRAACFGQRQNESPFCVSHGIVVVLRIGTVMLKATTSLQAVCMFDQLIAQTNARAWRG